MASLHEPSASRYVMDDHGRVFTVGRLVELLHVLPPDYAFTTTTERGIVRLIVQGDRQRVLFSIDEAAASYRSPRSAEVHHRGG